MTLVFDTSALSKLLRNDGNDSVARIMGDSLYDNCLIPLAVDAESRYGFKNGSNDNRNLSIYNEFKRKFNLKIISPNKDTSLMYAEIAAWCNKNGKSLSNNDIWIAATSVQYGADLITLDNDFNSLPQIRLAHL
jgi:predicted nucleic acid-binding protein